MVPLQNFATGVIADVIRRQPPSPARTTFAWTVAVGPALARSTTVTLIDQVLVVRSRDARWAKEIARASDTKRATICGFAAQLPLRTLIAAAFPITGCVAR